MIFCKCISKNRNRRNIIESYTLQDENGAVQVVKSNDLKKAIENKSIYVVNLKLTSDNRIIDIGNSEMQSLRELNTICRALHFSFDPSKVIIDGNTLEYGCSAQFLGVEIEIQIEMTDNRVSVTLTSDTFEISADGTKENIKLNKLVGIMNDYSKGAEYYKDHIDQLIKLCCRSVIVGDCAEIFEKSQYKLFDKIITTCNLREQASAYLKAATNKIRGNKDVVDRIQATIDRYNEDISIELMIIYAIFYELAIHGTIPDPLNIRLMPAGLIGLLK